MAAGLFFCDWHLDLEKLTEHALEIAGAADPSLDLPEDVTLYCRLRPRTRRAVERMTVQKLSSDDNLFENIKAVHFIDGNIERVFEIVCAYELAKTPAKVRPAKKQNSLMPSCHRCGTP